MDRPELPRQVKKYCRQKSIDGFSVEEIGHMIRNGEPDMADYSDSKIRGYLESDQAKKEIELERGIQEKKAEVSREDLIRELSEQKDHIIEQRQRLEGSNDEISSDQTKNLLKAIRQLGEMIDVLEPKDDRGAGNVIKVNNVEELNVAEGVEYMPRSDVEDIVEALQRHDEVEDFAVSWRSEEAVTTEKAEA